MAAWAFCATEHYLYPPLLSAPLRLSVSLRQCVRAACLSSSGCRRPGESLLRGDWLHLLKLEIWAHYVNRCYGQRGEQAWDKETFESRAEATEAHEVNKERKHDRRDVKHKSSHGHISKQLENTRRWVARFDPSQKSRTTTTTGWNCMIYWHTL